MILRGEHSRHPPACQDKRGIQKALEYLASMVLITYELRSTSRARLLRQAQDHLARLRVTRLSCDGLLAVAAGELDILVTAIGRRAVDHRHKDMAYERGRCWRRRCAS